MQRKYASLKLKSMKLHIILDDSFIYGVLWNKSALKGEKLSTVLTKKEESLLFLLKSEVDAYLKGELTVFSVPFKLEGTSFQLRVWSGLLKIPYGKTLSYKELATQLGDPNASRAVGTANSKNPISILIPCHRVIRANGEYGGYAGGESTKTFLLTLELENLS